MTWFNIFPDGIHLKEKISPLMKTQLPLAPTSFDVIGQVSGMKLLRFKHPSISANPRLKTPLFIVPSLINRYYILDLLPGKSLIEYLLTQGHDVYLLDWGTPQDEDNWLTLEHLITHRMDYFLDIITKDSEIEKVNLFGHCLGGTLTTLYTLIFPERINTLGLLTAPIDFEYSGKLGLWAKHDQFQPQKITQAYGQMPWWVLQFSFQMLKPFLPFQKMEKLFKELNNPEFIKNFFALEIWSQDNVSFPGLCFLTIIEELYKKNALIKNEFIIKGQLLSLRDLHAPTLSISASDDHIVLFDSTLQSHHLAPNVALNTITSLGGHIGSILGSRAQKNIWPEIHQWFSRWDMEKH